MADVFLSYARSDAGAAARLARELAASGWSVWYDKELPAHRAYSDVIERELENAGAVVVLWSAAAVESQWVRSEANRARELGKLVQARLDATRLPLPFDQIQCVDLKAGRRGRLQVEASVNALLGGEAARLREPQVNRSSRRQVLIGGGAAAAALVGGGYWLVKKRESRSVPPEAAALLDQAKAALWQNTPEGQNQAVGISRQVASANPELAPAWGRLAMSYALTSHWRGQGEAARLQQRARSAAKQALALDAHQALAEVGLALAKPFMGNWLAMTREIGTALRFDRKDGEVNFLLAMVLAMTGQNRDALTHVLPVLSSGPTPGIFVWNAQMLWSAGRDDDLDALLDEATKLYPTHFGVWFTRFYTAMMGGRPEIALALAADTSSWPTGIDSAEISAVIRVANAIKSPSESEIEAVVKEWRERARHGAGYAENAAQFLSALGRVDDAFAIMRAYYFSEGFDPGEVRFERAMGSFTAHNDRQTAFLFNPAMSAVRRDPRFAALTKELHLADYWRASGQNPDYLAG